MNPLSFVLGYLNFVTTSHKRAKTWSVGSAAIRVALRTQVSQFPSYKITTGKATWSWIVFAVTVWHFLLSFFLGLGCNLWIVSFPVWFIAQPQSDRVIIIYATTLGNIFCVWKNYLVSEKLKALNSPIFEIGYNLLTSSFLFVAQGVMSNKRRAMTHLLMQRLIIYNPAGSERSELAEKKPQIEKALWW